MNLFFFFKLSFYYPYNRKKNITSITTMSFITTYIISMIQIRSNYYIVDFEMMVIKNLRPVALSKLL